MGREGGMKYHVYVQLTVHKTKNKTIVSKLFFLTLQTEQAEDENFV